MVYQHDERAIVMAPRDSKTGMLGHYDPLLDVSIIIVSWNTVELLRACLIAIVKNAGSIKLEIIVVDNASHDGSAEMVASDFPSVHLLVNDRNMGFAVATNQGLSHARGRYVLLLNSDTITLRGALAEMVRYMDAHPRVGGMGPRLLNSDRSLQVSAYPFPDIVRDVLALLQAHSLSLVGRRLRRYSRRAGTPPRMQTGEVDWVVGACLMLRREALEQVGILDEGYFFGNEEVDLCLRLRRCGWSVVFLACAEIVHLGSQSWAHMSPTRVIWFYTGRQRYFRMHHTRWECLLQRAAIAVIAAGHRQPLLPLRRRSPDDRLWLSAVSRVLLRSLGGE